MALTSLLLAFLLGGASAQPQPAAPPAQARPQAPRIYDYRIVATYPHDPEAFTQGLFWLDGHLYESTGQEGRSTIRRVRLEDGQVVQSASIPSGRFGEGMVNWGGEIVSLTWQGGIGYRWDLRSLRRLGEWRYEGEGWGLTQNGRELIMSDGSADLRFLDPATFAERRKLLITSGGQAVSRLNELEWVNGEIYANVWLTPFIVRIDPASGHVTGIVDLRPLAAQHPGDSDTVLNGIAYDAERDRLFVTGKNWSRLYEIDLVPRVSASRP